MVENIAEGVAQFKRSLEYKCDRHGYLNTPVGKVNEDRNFTVIFAEILGVCFSFDRFFGKSIVHGFDRFFGKKSWTIVHGFDRLEKNHGL